MEGGSGIEEEEDEMPKTIAKLLHNEVPFAPSQYRHQQLAHDHKQVMEVSHEELALTSIITNLY